MNKLIYKKKNKNKFEGSGAMKHGYGHGHQTRHGYVDTANNLKKIT